MTDIRVLPLDALSKLIESVAGVQIDLDTPLADQGVDSLAMLDILTEMEDRTNITWELTDFDRLGTQASARDLHFIHIGRVGT